MKKIAKKIKQVKSNVRYCVYGKIFEFEDDYGNKYKIAITKTEPKTHNFEDGGMGWQFLEDFDNTEECIDNAHELALEWEYETNAELKYNESESK